MCKGKEEPCPDGEQQAFDFKLWKAGLKKRWSEDVFGEDAEEVARTRSVAFTDLG